MSRLTSRGRCTDPKDVTRRSPRDGDPAVLRWLRGNESDQTRYAAMYVHLQAAAYLSASVVVVKVLVSFWYGPTVLFLIAPALAVMGITRWLHDRVQHPQAVTAAAFACLEVVIAVSVVCSGGGTSPLLPLLAVPVFSQAICFRPPVFLAGVAASAAVAVPAALLSTAGAVDAPPWLHLAGYLALLVNVAGGGHLLVSADRDSRDDAVVDRMTGLFNRKTLADRFAAAQREARAADGSVGLVMVDVDHFKAINDTHGHDRGDQVLQQLADRLRTTLRDTDVPYRVGGEEFVVLLPGRDAESAQRVAERIRAAVAAEPLAGLPVTVSAGVVSAAGEELTLPELMRAADAALYRAKDAGRNRVVAADVDRPDRPDRRRRLGSAA